VNPDQRTFTGIFDEGCREIVACCHLTQVPIKMKMFQNLKRHLPMEAELLAAYETLQSLRDDDNDSWRAVIARFRSLAQRGCAGAQHVLACWLIDGNHVERDVAEGIRLLRLATDQGHLGAYCTLADCIAEGEGVPRDVFEFTRCASFAAERGDPFGYLQLALSHLSIHTRRCDPRAAKRYLMAGGYAHDLEQLQACPTCEPDDDWKMIFVAATPEEEAMIAVDDIL